MSPLEATWAIPADLARVAPLVLETASFLEQHGVGARPSYRVQLLLEEIVSNVVRHGLQGDRTRDVEVRVALDETGISLAVVDEASSFDPLRDAPAPRTRRVLADLVEGGLGLHLVKRMADELSYERRGNQNRVLMRVNLAPESPLGAG